MSITAHMRDVLLEHIDKAVPIVTPGHWRGLDAKKAAQRWATTLALIGRGLLRYDDKIKPTRTLITEAGRFQLCKLLGEYADALSRIGLEMPPAEVIADVIARKRPLLEA